MGPPRPLFNLFSSFQTHITNFTTNTYNDIVYVPQVAYYKKSNDIIYDRSTNFRPRHRLMRRTVLFATAMADSVKLYGTVNCRLVFLDMFLP